MQRASTHAAHCNWRTIAFCVVAILLRLQDRRPESPPLVLAILPWRCTTLGPWLQRLHSPLTSCSSTATTTTTKLPPRPSWASPCLVASPCDFYYCPFLWTIHHH